MKTLTASIVLYKTPKSQIESILKSVFDSRIVKTMFIIDNSPNDKWRILEKRSNENTEVRYIHNENLGYGASHNLAMQESIEIGSTYHVVLNPDIRFEKNVLSSLEDFMNENEDASYVLPKVVYPNGELQYLCKLLPTPSDLIFRRFLPKNSWTEKKDSHYCLKNFGYNKVINPPCLSGCFMFLRLSILRKYDIFFDDGYFMYFEDFDLIRRLHSVSKTLFFPSVSIIHDHAKQSYKNKKMLKAHIKSAIRYFNKYGWFFDKERSFQNKKILKEIEEMKNSISDSLDSKGEK